MFTYLNSYTDNIDLIITNLINMTNIYYLKQYYYTKVLTGLSLKNGKENIGCD